MMAPTDGTSTNNSSAAVVNNELNSGTTNNSSNISRNIKNDTNSNSSSYYHNDDLSCNSDTQTTSRSNNNDDNDNNGNEKTNLIVNYLPQLMTDAEFTKLFEEYGNIKTAKIVRQKGTGYSSGYGFVDFQTNAEALSAIEGLNGHELENKKIKVAFARPAGQDIKQANLYVKNIPNNWTQDDVRKLFESFGDIIQCRVLGNSRGVGFVLFNLRRQAEDALKALKGTIVSGGEHPLEIKFAADNAQKSGHSRSGSTSNNSSSSSAYKNHHGSNDRHNNTRALHNQQRNSTIAAFVSPYEPAQQQLMHQNFYPANNYYSQQQPFDNYTIRHQQGLRVQSQYTVPYGGGLQTNQFADQYNAYSNTPIGSPGPIRQSPTIRQNRYAPFTPQQTHMPPVQQMQQQASQSSYQYQDQRLIQPFNQAATQQPSIMQQPVDTPSSVPLSGLNVFSGNQSTSSIPQVVNPQFVVQNRAPVGPAVGSNFSHQTGSSAIVGNVSSNNAVQNQVVSNGDGVTLFVYNIGSDGDENLLQGLFSSFGPVLKCNVVRKPPNQECKGYGFVTLPDQKQANAAIKRMNGYIHNGRALQVSFKK